MSSMNESDDEHIISSEDVTAAIEAAKLDSSNIDYMNDDENNTSVPKFPALSAQSLNSTQSQYTRIHVPPHRYTPLKTHWLEIYQPVVEHMQLQIRFNPRKRCIELRTSSKTTNPNALTKSSDYIRSFLMGFELKDAIALLRLDDLYIDSFEIKDVKTLHGEHLSRAIGRIAGVGGKTKYTIENATKTRIVLANTTIHILGTFSNINIAKSAIVRLIMGSPPGKVYTQMRAVANRAKERF